KKQWNDRTPRSHYIAVAHDRKARLVSTRIGIAGDKQFVRNELSCAVEVDRAARLVSGQGDHSLHSLIDTDVNDVHCADYVSLYAFERVVFGRWNDFQCGRVNDVVDAIQGAG